MIRWKRLLLGATTFAVVHLVLVGTWQTWFKGGDGFAPWFMNSNRTVAFTVAVFVVINAIVAVATPLQRFRESILTACNISAGAVVVSIILLFRYPGGPGNLFPITIAIGTILIALASVAGGAVGWGIRSVVSRLSA